MILYGCGDFLNDYEGIGTQVKYRDDLVVMYLPVVRSDDGIFLQLTMIPFQIQNFRLNYASAEDIEWLADLFNREGRKFGTRVRRDDSYSLCLEWD